MGTRKNKTSVKFVPLDDEGGDDDCNDDLPGVESVNETNDDDDDHDDGDDDMPIPELDVVLDGNQEGLWVEQQNRGALHDHALAEPAPVDDDDGDGNDDDDDLPELEVDEGIVHVLQFGG